MNLFGICTDWKKYFIDQLFSIAIEQYKKQYFSFKSIHIKIQNSFYTYGFTISAYGFKLHQLTLNTYSLFPQIKGKTSNFFSRYDNFVLNESCKRDKPWLQFRFDIGKLLNFDASDGYLILIKIYDFPFINR